MSILVTSRTNRVAAIIAFQLLCLCFVLPLPAWAGLNDGFVAYYPFNGNANDAVNNSNNNGIVTGAVLTDGYDGSPNSAYQFDGSNDKIVVRKNDALWGQSFTIGAWAKLASLETVSILEAWNTSQGYGVSILHHEPDGKFYFQIRLAGTVYGVSTVAATYDPVNNWLHFLLTYDGTVLRAYINGEEIDSTSVGGAFAPPDADLFIGAEETYGNRYLDGAIDEVRIYNRALSVGEVSTLGSQPPATVTVPNTVNQTQAQAEAAITAAGLALGSVTAQSHATIAAGRVISQSPAAGSSVAPGTAINLIISNGPAQVLVTVPNTINQTQAQAGAAITAAGLALGSITSQHHATIAVGRVISQSRTAGSQIASGTAINLTISNGPTEVLVTVPNTVNQTQAEAEAAITATGLALGSFTSQAHATIADGRVINQSPPAGSQVEQSTAIDLVISSGFAPPALPAQLVVYPNDPYHVVLDTEHGATTPAPQIYSMHNPGGSTLDFRVTTTAPWLSVNPAQGQLEAGGLTHITVSANAAVHTLAPNQPHRTEVRFENLSDAANETVRSASAFVIADTDSSGVRWIPCATEDSFDGNGGCFAAEDIPPNVTAVFLYWIERLAVQQVGAAAAEIPDFDLRFRQRRSDMGPQDNLTAHINGQPIKQWTGVTNGWEQDVISLDQCGQFPCAVTFAFQERPDTPDSGASGAVYLDNLGLGPDVQPYASVLPGSRSAQIGQSVTAFAALINAGTAMGEDCALRPVTPVPGEFSYQTTDPATNQPVGIPNVPRDIPAGGVQSFVFVFTPDAAMDPTDVELRFDCSNSGPADVDIGLNTFLLSASAQPVPDIVALGATTGGDGIVNIPGDSGTGAFSVASVNVGSGGAIRVAADTGGIELPVRLLLCETDPLSGTCFRDPANEVTTDVAANATPTFSIFVLGTGPVGFNPAAHRVFVRFRDQNGVVRGATSVAVQTQ